MGKAEKTRAAIIEQVAEVFNRKGYSGASLQDLTEATQLTKGAIYGNFADKQEVAAEALKYNIDRIAAVIVENRNSARCEADRLMAYPNAYHAMYKWILSNGGCPIANTLTDADDTNPQLNRLALLFVKKWRRDVEKTVEAGKKSGEFLPDTNGSEIGKLLLTLISGGAMLAKATQDHGFMDSALTQAEQIISKQKSKSQ
ncbi:MAG: TetR/AcrR family transcriptional regulator [Spirochaetia bacterium]|nr:TetR/AcrR family transcriptional regulator [Spirochaetia bacterium]